MLALSRLRKDQGGATAVEFALVAVPFFLLLYAILDIALIFFASTTLENGIVAAARKIRTGEAQASNMSKEQFRDLVCDQVSMMLACDERLGLDVRKFDNFANVNFENALDASGKLKNNMKFDPGDAGDVVVVRAFYSWPIMTPTAGTTFVNMAGGHRLLEAGMAFRNEPYQGPIAN
jgi:Flp pilus assembly protein TadG